MELEQALARVSELEGQLAASGARVAELEGVVSAGVQVATDLEAATARVAELTGQVGTTTAALLDATRRALVAENQGAIIGELVVGDTPEALTASVEAAKAAYDRVVAGVRAGTSVPPPPPSRDSSVNGGSTAMDNMRPLDRIAAGLSGKSA